MNLTWQEIILKMEFIVLGAQRTKNKKPEGRFCRILRLLTSWGAFLIAIHSGYILDRAKGLTAIRTTKLLKLLELLTFTFPDLRHCAINNIRLAVNGHYTRKQDYGHKKDIAYIRYNLVIEEEVQWMKWLDKTGVKNGMMDAWYGDRSKSLDCINPFKLLKSFGAPTVTRTRS